jgi:hypothetical protein
MRIPVRARRPSWRLESEAKSRGAAEDRHQQAAVAVSEPPFATRRSSNAVTYARNDKKAWNKHNRK